MSKKYDPGLINEVQARKKAEDEFFAKKLKSIACNHAAYPSLFHLWTKVDRVKMTTNPPKGMTGYAYICRACQEEMGKNGITKEQSRKCFTDMWDFDLQKRVEEYNSVVK